jgi:hypothetical protein
MANKAEYLKLKVFSRLDLTLEKALDLRDLNLPSKEHIRRSKQLTYFTEAADRLLRFLAEYDSGFYCPERCDVYEPIREIFDPDDLSDPIRWLSQPSGEVKVKKMKPFRYEGFVENKRVSHFWVDSVNPPEPIDRDRIFVTEWCIWLKTNILKLKSLEEIKQFFINLYLVSEGDYGFLTMEKDHENKNYLITEDKTGTSMRFVGTNLEQCLPGVYWANIFGPLYVDMFGEEKFSTIPCFSKEKLSDGSYFVQSAEDIRYFENPEMKNYVKDIIKHLGRKAFFDIRKPGRRCQVPDYVKRNRRSNDPWSV